MPYGEKQWKEAVKIFKVLIPGNDKYEENPSVGSQPDYWTQSSCSGGEGAVEFCG